MLGGDCCFDDRANVIATLPIAGMSVQSRDRDLRCEVGAQFYGGRNVERGFGLFQLNDDGAEALHECGRQGVLDIRSTSNVDGAINFGSWRCKGRLSCEKNECKREYRRAHPMRKS
ncbi:MAG: hypothetical protein DME50_16970 [Verrucomicrobia bacterium]|nr:MAG: hypothetical protein DME50_16970 [Verrucomicrobiota bacterium]